MTTIKNMAYWRSKNGVKSNGSYDGGDLKAKRSPMRHQDEDHGRTHDHNPKTGEAHWYGALLPDEAKKKWGPGPKPPKDKESSPNKQTKSGRGNIFTKEGRNQKLVNKHARLSKKLEENDNSSTYLKKRKVERKMKKRGIEQWTGADDQYSARKSGEYWTSKDGYVDKKVTPKSKK